MTLLSSNINRRRKQGPFTLSELSLLLTSSYREYCTDQLSFVYLFYLNSLFSQFCQSIYGTVTSQNVRMIPTSLLMLTLILPTKLINRNQYQLTLIAQVVTQPPLQCRTVQGTKIIMIWCIRLKQCLYRYNQLLYIGREKNTLKS